MNQVLTNQIIIVIGKKGSGKSYFVKNELLPKMKPFIVVDHLSEYGNPDSDNSRIRVPIYNSIDDFMIDIEKGELKSCITRFDNDPDNEFLFELCFELSNHTLVVEEISKFCNPHYISEHLQKIFRYGRHKKINVVGVTQRPHDLNKIVSSQADYWIIFQQTEPRDILYIEQLTGQKMNDLSALNQREYKVVKF